MNGWKGVIWASFCATGVLLFLKAVADEVDRVERTLRELEQLERRASEKRKASGLLSAGGMARAHG